MQHQMHKPKKMKKMMGSGRPKKSGKGKKKK